jgi:hypothetical protein
MLSSTEVVPQREQLSERDGRRHRRPRGTLTRKSHFVSEGFWSAPRRAHRTTRLRARSAVLPCSLRPLCPDIGVKIAAVAGARHEPGANDEFAEAFAVTALGGVSGEYRVER